MKLASFKQVLKYIFLLGISVALLLLALRGVEISEVLHRLSEVNWFWVILSLAAALIAFILRAWRWGMLLQPIGFYPSFLSTFSALMIGYLANFALPRIGEVVRCGVLHKNEKVPVSSSLGTVLAERALDFVMLVLVTLLTLFLEWDRLESFLMPYLNSSNIQLSNLLIILGLIALALALLCLFLFRQYHARLMQSVLYQKIMGFGKNLIQGLLSIGRVKQQFFFWASTCLIWVMYYLMTYLIMRSLAHTADVNFMVGMSLLTMGGVAMVVPTPGGVGSYHFLIRETLLIYSIAKADAVFLTLLMHTSQSLLAIFLGAICLLISLFRGKKRVHHETEPA